MKRIFTFLIVSACLSICGFGQITWTKTQGPYGGYIKTIIVHPTNFTAYALGGYNGGGKLFRSPDNGTTWVEQTSFVFGNDIGQFNDIDVLPDGTLFLVSYNNLYKSTDDGATWTKINTGTSSTSNGFDQGSQFAKNSFSGTIYVSGYDYGAGKYTLFRSTNNGSTYVKGYQDPSNYTVTQISITGNGDVYGIVGGKLMRSADDGNTFIAVSTPSDANSVSSLTSTPDGSLLAMVTSSSNMYTLASTVAIPSTTWSAALTETGIADVNYGSGSALLRFSLDKTTMFLMDNQNNKFYSRTSGSWTSKNTTFVTTNNEDAICFVSKDVNTLYVGTNDIGIWKSINGGSGWLESNTGIEASYFNSIVIADDGSAIVAGERAYRSSDNGTSWSRIGNVVAQNYYAFKASTGSPKPIVLLGTNGQASFRSTNSGGSWSSITATPGNAYNFYSADGTKIYGAGNSQIFYTSDQGTTWSAALTITGTGWPTGSYNISYVAIDQLSNIYTYFYDYNASTYKFFKITPNNTTTPTTGAATQISLSTIGVTSVNAIGYSNNTVFVTGYGNSGTILSSTNNQGSTWTTSSSAPSGYRIDNDPMNNYLFITNSNNNQQTVNLSRDGGANFSSSTINLSSNKSQVYGYALNASGVAFAGVSNSSVYKTTGTIVIPVAPTSLISSGKGTDRITLRWIDNATNEDRFIIEKFNGTGYDSVGYKSSNSTTGAKVYYEVKNLQANTSYTFRVTAKNTAGTTSATPLAVTTLTQCATTVPDNKSWNGNVVTSTPATVALTNVTIKSLGNGFFSITDVVNGTISGQNTNIPGIFFESCGNTYLNPDYPTEPNSDGTWTSGTNTLVLKWITDNGITPEITGTVTLTKNASDPIPAAPSSTTAYVYNNTSIEVSWLGSAFETQYVVERSKDNFTSIDLTLPLVDYPATSVIDNTGLVSNTTYYYRVKAKNTAGTSAASNIATILLSNPNFVLSGSIIESTPAYSTTGPIWGDFNNDGFDDLIMPQLTFFTGTPTIPLSFRNDGAGNFVSITPTGITPSPYIVGSAADYDNDGKLDLFLTSDASQNFLYKGNGDFTFTLVGSTPVSTNYNVGGSLILDLGASWGDYNNDGLIDLYVVTNDNSVKSKLYTQGPVGTFTLATTGGLQSVMVQGSVANWADYDNDGDLDIFIADSQNSLVNQLYKNNGDGTFTRVTGSPFDTDVNERSFTSAWGDYNNDTYLDLFIGARTNNLLYKNNGNGTFTSQSMPTSVTKPLTNSSDQTFGSAWGDINNDGFVDLLVTIPGEESHIYINTAGTGFTDVKTEKFNDIKVPRFGVGFSDYNKDGLLDFASAVIDPSLFGGGFVSGPTVKNQLFKNNASSAGNWIELKLTGTTSNKLGIGARVTLVAGGKTQIRELASSNGFCTQNSQMIHFGLGSSTTITSIQVKWPSGISQTLSGVNSNQLLAITEDNTGPVASTLSPANGATNVNANTTLAITLNESSTAVATKNLKLFLTSDLVNPVATLDVSTAVVSSGTTFTFTLPQNLIHTTNYSVTVDAGAFKDIYGNASLAMNASSWQFTSAAGPVASVLSPANGATGVNANTTLAITLNNVSTGVATKTIKLFKTSDLVNPIASINVSTGTIVGNTFTFTLPQNLLPSTSYSVSIDDGAFKDANGNLSAAMSASSWQFTSAVGPVVNLLNPLNSASNVPVNTKVEITFDKAPTAVAGKKISVTIQGSGSPEFSLDVSTGTITGNKISFTPPAALGFLNIYDVAVDVGAFTDSNGNATTAITWSFVTVDNVAPVITFTPPQLDYKFNSTSFAVTVTDNSATVSSATLSYRKIGGGSFTDLPGTLTSGTWNFTVQESFFDANGLEFYLTAKDPANNVGRLPLDPNTNFYSYLNYKASDNIVPSAQLGFGGTASGWKIFTIPFDYGTNNAVSTVFSQLSSLTIKTDWRMLTYKDKTAWAEYPDNFSTFTRGQGYFINIKTPVTLKVPTATVSSNNRKNLFQMVLKKGWNQVGNPYLTPISWDDVKNFTGNAGLTGTGAVLKTYTNPNYVNATTLQPFEGGFVLAESDVTVSIPFSGQTAIGGRQEKPTIGENDWIMPLTLKNGDIENNFGGVGMHSQALFSYDQFDDINAPRFINYLEMNFAHPEHFAKQFARDVVPTQAEYTWEFTLSGNMDGATQLTWDNSVLSSNPKELFLYDVGNEVLVNMREHNTYSIDPKKASLFRIYFGDDLKDKIKPDNITLGDAYPNPSRGNVTIPFTLPENQSKYQVALEVYNTMGQKVSTLVEGVYSPGFYSSQWETSQSTLSNGLYIYRIKVSDKNRSVVLSGKIVINQ